MYDSIANQGLFFLRLWQCIRILARDLGIRRHSVFRFRNSDNDRCEYGDSTLATFHNPAVFLPSTKSCSKRCSWHLAIDEQNVPEGILSQRELREKSEKILLGIAVRNSLNALK